MADEIIGVAQKAAFDYSTPRVCKKCGVTFSGRGCKECHNAAKRERRKANPEKEKPSAAAYRQKHREEIAKKAVEYREKYPDIVKATKIAYREKNKESISRYEEKYRAEHRELILQKASAYRKITKPKKRAAAQRYRRENPEKVKAQFASWVKANPEANRVRVQNRRARRIANGGTLSKGLADKLLVLQKGKCPCCGRALGTDYHLDHIVPLARGGSNSDGNMQLLTKACNLQKHAKDPIDFMQERGFLI